ncbi:MAG: hypothetical protein AAGB93_23815, partial [Planctomycetota bacterium]
MTKIPHVSALALAPSVALVLTSLAGAAPQAGSGTLQRMDVRRLSSPLRNAGIYHVRTGTWTRTPGGSAAMGPDVLYSNDAQSGYFTSAGGAGGFGPGAEVFDEGVLPGTTNLNAPLATDDFYSVNGFEIGYCDEGAPGTGGWRIQFYSSYAACTSPTTAPAATFDLTGLPADGCWVMTIDLAGGDEFCMEADGGPVAPGWDDDPALDSFGWSYRYIGTDGTKEAGFELAGNPRYTDPNYAPNTLPVDGTGTYFGPPSLCETPMARKGTGFQTQDRFWLEEPPGLDSQCSDLGGYRNRNGCTGDHGNPYGSFHMQLLIEAGAGCGPGSGCGTGGSGITTVYCNSNPNSTGLETCISATGTSVALANDVTLIASNMPTNSF